MKKVFLFIVLTASCLSFISCADFMYGLAAGLMGAGYGSSPYSTYASPYGTTTTYPTTSSYSSASSYSSTSTTSITIPPTTIICANCGGSGKCKRCGGSGQLYDYGPLSVISKEKYKYKCTLCDGTGKCGCMDDGKVNYSTK